MIGTRYLTAHAQEEFREREFLEEGRPKLADSRLGVETVISGLDTPTTMAFLGPNDILVLEKDKGTVQRIVNGEMLPQPLLDVNVANSVERCMCGIAISKHDSTTTYVFLYYTEATGKDGEDREGKEPLGNRLYRFELVDNKLVNPLRLLDVTALPGPRHNGGAIIIGLDNNLYIPIGDIDGSYKGGLNETMMQNYRNGAEPDGRGGILRISQDGLPTGKGILGDGILEIYYAYGVRNSFGLAFDPVTGKLWDTENGPGNSDEINLVEPGFNSGWQQVMGMAKDEEGFKTSNLVDFDGKGDYRDPELVWLNTAGPTSIIFMTSDKLGSQYVNDMFVGDVHNGRIYHFDLTSDRTHLVLPSPLASKVIKSPNANGLDEIIFGDRFGGITDLEIGPDGYLYVVSVGLGTIFRIVPT